MTDKFIKTDTLKCNNIVQASNLDININTGYNKVNINNDLTVNGNNKKGISL